jgi:hypothetical protein
MSEINSLIQEICEDDSVWGPLYGQIGAHLYGAHGLDKTAELAGARRTNQKLNRRAQAAEKINERYVKAVREWLVSETETYVPYDSLKVIGRLAGVEILPQIRYMQRFENSRQAEEFVERIYGLLEYWNSVTPPFGPPQSWWWEDRRAELSDVLAGRDSPSAQDNLRAQVRAALAEAGVTPASAATSLGLSAEYLGQMLSGKAVLTLGWAEQILALCGQRLEIRAISAIPVEGEEA